MPGRVRAQVSVDQLLSEFHAAETAGDDADSDGTSTIHAGYDKQSAPGSTIRAGYVLRCVLGCVSVFPGVRPGVLQGSGPLPLRAPPDRPLKLCLLGPLEANSI